MFHAVFGLCVVGAVIFAAISQTMSPETNVTLFAETGPFEQASPWLWLGLAVLIVAVFRRASRGVIAGVILSVAAAAREWDMHKSFTGYSVLKPGFYTTTEYPLHQQAIAGVIVLAILASGAYLAWLFWKLRPWMSSPRPAWLFALALAIFMVGFTKVLDRAPAIIRNDFGIHLPERLDLLMGAWEEGLEMLLAVFFAVVVLAYAMLTRTPHQRPRLSAAH